MCCRRREVHDTGRMSRAHCESTPYPHTRMLVEEAKLARVKWSSTIAYDVYKRREWGTRGDDKRGKQCIPSKSSVTGTSMCV